MKNIGALWRLSSVEFTNSTEDRRHRQRFTASFLVFCLNSIASSHMRVISSRRYPGHRCKSRLSSFGDLTWRSRELDDNIRDQFKRSLKHRPINFKLCFVAPWSSLSHCTSRRGFRLDIKFERFVVALLSERFKVFSSCSRAAVGRPSPSYMSISRSGESSV